MRRLDVARSSWHTTAIFGRVWQHRDVWVTLRLPRQRTWRLQLTEERPPPPLTRSDVLAMVALMTRHAPLSVVYRPPVSRSSDLAPDDRREP